MSEFSKWDTTPRNDAYSGFYADSQFQEQPGQYTERVLHNVSGGSHLLRTKQAGAAVKSELTSSLSIAGRMSLDASIKPSTFNKGSYHVTAHAKRNPRDLGALSGVNVARRSQPIAASVTSETSSPFSFLSGSYVSVSKYSNHASSGIGTLRHPNPENSSNGPTVEHFPIPTSSEAHPRGLSCQIGRKFPPAIRRPFIQRPWLRPISSLHLAALIIQTAWRRCRARRALEAVIEAVEQEPRTRYLHNRLPMIAAWSEHGSAALAFTGLNNKQLKRLSIARKLQQQNQMQQLQQQPQQLLQTRNTQNARDHDSDLVEIDTAKLVKNQSIADKKFSSIAAEREFVLSLSRNVASIPEERKVELTSRLVFAVAAFVIQRAWRARVAGKESRRRALPILRKHRAARAIQRAWKSFRDRRVFQHLKELVLGRTLSDPIQLMKVICPSEAHIADAASGLYVRFRLGGPTFPPLLFYKIYTMRPVADIGSFAPRNYAANAALAAAAVQSKLVPEGLTIDQGRSPRTGILNSAGDAYTSACMQWELQRNQKRTVNQNLFCTGKQGEVDPQLLGLIESCKEWYRRCDNNGWRLVSGSQVTVLNPKLENFLNIGQPRPPRAPELPHPYFFTNAHALDLRRGGGRPVQWDTPGPLPIAMEVAKPSANSKPYHPDRLVRHVDVVKKKKRTKLKWLQNLYRLALSSNSRSESQDSLEDQKDRFDEHETADQSSVGLRKIGGDVVLFDQTSIKAPTVVGELLLGADPDAEEVCMPAFWDELGTAAQDDDIITWAAELDYESYAQDWGCLGTTRPACAPPPIDDNDE